MLDKPLSDAQGNKLSLMRVMPGLLVDITLTAADQRIVSFRADAQALRTLSAAFAAAASVAELGANV